jgi:UDP-N-acetylglucosamine:LPS N-acetylglucosamine transferase
MKTILAISSGGGHWVQLLRLRPAFQGHRVVFATVSRDYQTDVGDNRFYRIPDATQWDKLGALHSALCIASLLVRVRPHIVLSTGALPGFLGVRLGHLLGARTIWIDSIANVEKISKSGSLIGPHADLWLTQWPHLARPEGPHYCGAVL